MKKLFLIALVAIPVIFGTACNNNDDDSGENSCIIGTWKTQVNPTGTPCDLIIEYKSDGTGTSKILDCNDYCNQVGLGSHPFLNDHVFNYTISNGNQITQVVQGQINVCGSPDGTSGITTNGTFTCNGNTLVSTGSNGSSVTLTRQ